MFGTGKRLNTWANLIGCPLSILTIKEENIRNDQINTLQNKLTDKSPLTKTTKPPPGQGWQSWVEGLCCTAEVFNDWK